MGIKPCTWLRPGNRNVDDRHAVVVGVGHEQFPAVGRHGHRVGRASLRSLGKQCGIDCLCHHTTLGIDHGYAIGVGAGHENPIVRRADGDLIRMFANADLGLDAQISWDRSPVRPAPPNRIHTAASHCERSPRRTAGRPSPASCPVACAGQIDGDQLSGVDIERIEHIASFVERQAATKRFLALLIADRVCGWIAFVGADELAVLETEHVQRRPAAAAPPQFVFVGRYRDAEPALPHGLRSA